MKVKGKKNSLPDEVLGFVAGRFRVLSEPLRLAILQTLMSGEKNVTEIIDAVGSSQPNVSKHLAILDQAGFVGRRKQGVSVYYSIIDDTAFKLCDLICNRMKEDFTDQVSKLKKLQKKVS